MLNKMIDSSCMSSDSWSRNKSIACWGSKASHRARIFSLLPSPSISCCGTPELREGLQCLEQVGDAPQATGEPGCHAAQDTLGLLVRASAFSGRSIVEGIPLAGGDGEVERECHDQDQPG